MVKWKSALDQIKSGRVHWKSSYNGELNSQSLSSLLPTGILFKRVNPLVHHNFLGGRPHVAKTMHGRNSEFALSLHFTGYTRSVVSTWNMPSCILHACITAGIHSLLPFFLCPTLGCLPCASSAPFKTSSMPGSTLFCTSSGGVSGGGR